MSRIKNNDWDKNQIPGPDGHDHDSNGDLSAKGCEPYAPIPMANLCADTAADFALHLKNNDGKYVLYRGANTKLTEEHLDALRTNGVKRLHISREDRTKYIRYMETHLDTILSSAKPVSKRAAVVYQTAHQLLEDVMLNPGSGANITRVDNLVETTISKVITDSSNLVHLLEVMAFDYSTYTHSVNVGILGLSFAFHLGYTIDEMSKLGSGLLLHDVGKSQISRDILFKKGPLTDEEWILVQKHPAIGRELLDPSGKVEAQSMIVVVQHHEKCNGCGYPAKLREDEIHPFAKIAMVVDVFDALTTERSYKSAIDSFPAIQIMLSEMDGSFCREYLREFVLMLNQSAKGRSAAIEPGTTETDDEAA